MSSRAISHYVIDVEKNWWTKHNNISFPETVAYLTLVSYML